MRSTRSSASSNTRSGACARSRSSERRNNPKAPYTTSKLQQDASSRLGFNVRRTMGVAQRLYEGVEIGSEGTVGLITYMRTDSTRVSADAIAEAREFIGKLGARVSSAEPNEFAGKKQAQAQDAHEAIRPTSVKYTPDSIRRYLSDEQFRLYRLIWQRFVVQPDDARGLRPDDGRHRRAGQARL